MFVAASYAQSAPARQSQLPANSGPGSPFGRFAAAILDRAWTLDDTARGATRGRVLCNATIANRRRKIGQREDDVSIFSRRSFVLGSGAAALIGRPLLCARRLPDAHDHRHQPVSAGRRIRCRVASAGGGHGADRQTAGHHRDQGRRGRRDRRAICRHRQTGRLHAAVAHHVDLRLCRGRSPVRPPAQSSPTPISFRLRASLPIRA